MATNKKSELRRWCSLVSAIGIGILLVACEPQGPKALLEGEHLMEQGKLDEALRMLEFAAERMPREARAWNLLALAHHRKGDLQQASDAYNKALVLDHKLSAARFNLGCLYLELGQPARAVNELTAFSLVQRQDLNGWLKLALAHWRLNHVEAAEVSYRNALTLSPREPEALNGLGLIQAGRKRYVEAVQYFQAALAENPGYTPALLNQATVTHRNLNQRSTALQKYRQYLAIQPPPDDVEAVGAIAQALAEELSGSARTKAAIVGTNSPAPRSNFLASATLVTRTNLTLKTTSPAVVAIQETRRPSPVPTNSLVSSPAVTPTVAPPPIPTRSAIVETGKSPQGPPVTPVTPAPPAPPPLTVAEVPGDVVISRPQELVQPPAPAITASDPTRVAGTPNAAPTIPVPPPSAVSDEGKRGFFSRLNPFKKVKSVEAPARPPSVSLYANPTPVQVVPPPTESPIPSGNFARYNYRSLPRPQAGNRIKAVELINKGVMAHREHRDEEEEGLYRSALITDPSSFDALLNLGTLAAERGAWPVALDYYERALTLNPESGDARYQFAIALRQANFPVDAGRELERVLQGQANDPKALLALGNLHAQRFKQPSIARHYYMRFLEAEPNHPKASDVRFWLTANP